MVERLIVVWPPAAVLFGAMQRRTEEQRRKSWSKPTGNDRKTRERADEGIEFNIGDEAAVRNRNRNLDAIPIWKNKLKEMSTGPNFLVMQELSGRNSAEFTKAIAI